MMRKLVECEFKCWCEFCSGEIKKKEKCLIMYKQARKGTTRINICKNCLIKVFIELNVNNQELSKIKKEIILENL